jgi:hypothetical protein
VVLSEYGIEALHPDDFLRDHLHLAPGIFLVAVQKVRARLKNPPFSAQEYLDNLTVVRLRTTALELRQYITLI